MWIQQTTISSVIICTTAFGMLFYAVTIFVSVWRADSPFQTPGSEIVGALCKRCLQVRSTLTHNIFSKSSAIRWILETSTNPEVVEAAAAMIPLTQWSRELDASAAYARLRDNFSACRDSEELFVKCGKAMAHLCSQSVKIHRVLLLKSLNIWHYWGGKSRFLRDAFMDSRLACHQLNNTKEEDARRKHKADVRTALRTMVVHGLFDRLSLPDNEKLIWQGDLRWRHSNGLVPGCEEFDWLIDYLVDEADDEPDEATQGDALLVLNAMRGLGSSAKQQSYIKALTLCMGPTRPPRVRHAALKAISDARGEIVSITDSHDNAKLLDDLSCALFTAVCPNHDQTIHDTGPDAFFNADRDHCYFRLVFALAKHDEWRQRLTRDGHLERCISLFDEVLECETWTLACYLIGIFMRIDPSDRVLPFSPTKEKWRMIVRKSWRHTRYLMLRDFVETLPALVTVTRQNFTGSNDGVSSEELTDLAEDVHRYLAKLQDRQAILVNSEADSLFDVALSSVQGLYDDLSHMIETQKTS
ncbi:uncharacterized protein EDB91DRAFT_1132968 [Suillus paluster]|uniref:uncharacterized protein n=1 Tax=Suillus paluster TaxID=48578 RepID=UPI001B862922|nr:uncharacterized protein EDB91DRAFT_1132968 [Suillus paluster]KAG1740525.1 hypothetical protein EDB91DRAFT_1132968 [Suillus paluster]